MSRKQICAYALAYTLLMCVVVAVIPGTFAPGILIAIANVWFWIGRMSTKSEWIFDPQSAKALPKWGRG